MFSKKQALMLLASIMSYVTLQAQNIGIGTANPQNKLEIAGGGLGIQRSDPNAAIWFNSSADINHVLWNDYFGGPLTKGAAGSGLDGMKWNLFNGIHFRTGSAGSTDRLIISHTDNRINLLNSNVGIGTSTPGRRLDVAGQGRFQGSVDGLEVTGSTEPGIRLTNSGFSTWDIFSGGGGSTDYNNDLTFFRRTGGSGNVLFSHGNVGIGTPDPAEKLHLSNGDNSVALFGPNATWNAYLYVGAGTNKISTDRAQVISTSGNLHLDAATNRATYINFYSQTNTFINPQGGNVGIGNSNPSFKLDVTGAGRYTDQLTIPLTPSANQHAASKKYVDDEITASVSGADDWDKSTNDIYNNNSGNIGIGTSSPTGKLDVAGSLVLKRSTANAAIWFQSGTDQNHVLWNDYYGGPTTRGAAASGFDGIKWNTFDGIQFRTGLSGATERLLVLHDENEINLLNSNVGIGTGTPASILHVMGRTHIHQSGAGGGQNRFEGLDSPTSANGRAQLILSSSYSDLVIASSQGNGTHGSTLTFATYNPSNASDFRKWVFNQGNWGTRDRFLEIGYNGGNISNPHLAINDNNTVLTMDGTNRYAGIGTRSPETNLHIRKTTGSGDNRATVYFDQTADNSWGHVMMLRTRPGGNDGSRLLFRSRDEKNWSIGGEGGTGATGFGIYEDGGDGVYGTGFGTNRFMVAVGGNVGIGITNPSYKLHVAGNIRTNGINETSDGRLKKNIEPIVNAMSLLRRIDGVKYEWKKEEYPQYEFKEGVELGVIAQEVEKVFPEVVATDQEGFKSVQYSHLVPVLIEALKEQDKNIQDLKAENNSLKLQVADYEAFMQKLDKDKLLEAFGKSEFSVQK